MFAIACCLVVGLEFGLELGLDLVTSWLVFMHIYLYYVDCRRHTACIIRLDILRRNTYMDLFIGLDVRYALYVLDSLEKRAFPGSLSQCEKRK